MLQSWWSARGHRFNLNLLMLLRTLGRSGHALLCGPSDEVVADPVIAVESCGPLGPAL
jgi:hypothetical protein